VPPLTVGRKLAFGPLGGEECTMSKPFSTRRLSTSGSKPENHTSSQHLTYVTFRITNTRELPRPRRASRFRRATNRKRRKPNCVAATSGASAT
jgi:hypothetical protein